MKGYVKLRQAFLFKVGHVTLWWLLLGRSLVHRGGRITNYWCLGPNPGVWFNWSRFRPGSRGFFKSSPSDFNVQWEPLLEGEKHWCKEGLSEPRPSVAEKLSVKVSQTANTTSIACIIKPFQLQYLIFPTSIQKASEEERIQKLHSPRHTKERKNDLGVAA